MSNVSQYALSLNITANASQHNATLVDAAQVGKRFGSDVQTSATTASAGLQKVVEQAERVAPALTQATTATTTGLNATGSAGQALKQTLGGVGDAAQKAGAASAQGFNQASISAKQYQAALRGVPAQFTDIFTSLASGQAPMTVLMQQGGQLKDMFGGAGNAARALGGYVAGLVTPLTATAAAAALLVSGAYAGSQESKALQNAIINSGNAAGVTQGQLMGMAAGVDVLVGTQGRAVEVLSAFVATGKVGAAHIEEFTAAAMRFESVGGAAAEDTAKSFAELGKAPVEASLKLNDSMGYLTASTYQQIKALADQGKHTDAAEVAQQAFADTLNSRAGQMEANLGLVEKGWKGIKSAVSEAWDAIKNIGRDVGVEGQASATATAIKNLEAQIALRGSTADDTLFNRKTLQMKEELAALKERQSVLQSDERLLKGAAQAQAHQVQLAKDLAEWDKRGEKYKSDQQKLNDAINVERKSSQKLINDGLMTEKQLQERIAAIREEYAKKGGKPGDTELANIVARVAAERQNLDLLKTQGLHYDKLNDGERTALQLTEQLTAKLDVKTRKSKEAQLVQAQALADVLNQQEAERQLQQARTAAAALDEKLTAQQIGQYQQSIDQLVTGNNQLRTEIDLVGKDAAARREYLVLKAQEVIAAKELEVINLRNAGARQEVINKAEQELRLLRDKLTLTGQASSAQDGQAAKDMLIAIQRETEALGQSNEQRQVTIALRELEAKGIKAGSAAYDEYIPKIKAAIAGKAVSEQSVAFWGSVENVAHDAWNHIGEQGENAAQRIERALKAGVWDMLWQITGRRWLIDIGASIGVPGAALAQSSQSAGLFSTASNAASLYNAGTSLMGMGGVASSAGIISGATYGTAAGSAQSIMLAGQEVGGTIGSAMIAGAESAGSILSVAFDPITLGIGALVAVLSSMDDSGTYHTGGGATYSAAIGAQQASVGFALDPRDISTATVDAAKVMTQTIVTMLDATAKTFGLAGGYTASTAFARDSSADGEWGALRIALGGKTLLDWADTQTSRWAPKEFADGDAGAAQYASAVAASIRDVLITQTPAWADTMLNALGDAPALDQLGTVVNQINAAANALDVMGQASAAFAGLTEATTAALIKSMGGASAATSSMSAYYADYYSESERTAIYTAQLTGKFAELGRALPASRDELKAWVDAAVAAGDADLAAKLISLAPALTTIRTAAADAATAAKSQSDMQSAATSALERAADRQRDVIQRNIDGWQTLVTEVGGVADWLSNTVADVRQSALTPAVASAAGQAQLSSMLSAALATGALPDQAGLEQAVNAVRSGINAGGAYGNATDRSFASLALAGQLETLQGVADDQLTSAERALLVDQQQLEVLDQTVAYWKDHLALQQTSIDATLTVEQAIVNLQEALKPGSTSAKKDAVSSASQPIISTTGSSMDAYRGSMDGLPDYMSKDWVSLGGRYVNVSSQTMANPEDYYAARLQQAYWSPEADMRSTFEQLSQPNFAGSASALLDIAKAAGLSNDIVASYVKEFYPSYDVGTAYVPSDGPAFLHAGERVLTADENRIFRSIGRGQQQGDSGNLAVIFTQLLDRIAALEGAIKAGNAHAKVTADTVSSVRLGNAFVMAAAPTVRY